MRVRFWDESGGAEGGAETERAEEWEEGAGVHCVGFGPR